MIHLQNESIEAHAFQTAKDSNFFCGDSFYLTMTEDYFLCVLADGLGSGEHAYEASQAAVSVVKSNPDGNVDTLMDYCNKALVKKRGAAVAILKVHFKQKVYEYSCVGNIRFYVYTPQGKLHYPMPVTGFLSGRPQNFRTQKYTYVKNSKFLLHSDGFINVKTRELLGCCQSVTALAEHLKVKQVNNSDDMSFVVGTFL